MAITSADLKFIASERMIDNLSTVAGVGGGGPMSQTLVVDGTENNVFPDVMPGDRTAGKQQLRQVYPIVLSADNATLYNAAAGLSARPSDANVEVVAFTIPTGNLAGQAAAAVGTRWTAVGEANTGPSSGSNSVDLNPSGPIPGVGDLVRLRKFVGGTPAYVELGMRLVTAVTGDLVTLDGDGFGSSGLTFYVYALTGAGAGARVSAVSLLTAEGTAAAGAVTVDKLWATVQLPGSSSLDTPGEPSGRSGQLPLYLPGDQLLIEHGSTPTTREVHVVESVNYSTGVVSLVGVLAVTFPIGSKVTRLVALGSLQAQANNIFAQQTWTRSWSDAAIGSSISSRYSGSIAMVNEGGVTDRWACVFTSSTQYNLLSERLGQIGSGNIATDYLPLNPMTNEPYFTLAAAGWGTGWLPGNALRFNTVAASSPLWLNRLVKPSTAAGTDQATLFMRGDVDA
jgi:hypothetical protein